MPDITSCPECEKKLRLPDDLFGKKVRCPGCGLMFIAKPYVGIQESAARPAPPAAVARERQPSPPVRPSRDDRDERFRRRDERDDYDRPERRDDRDDYRSRDRRREYEDDYDRDRRYDEYDYDRYDRYDDEEPQPQLSRVAIRWKRVYLGLTLVLLGALGLIATFVLGQLSNLLGLLGGVSAMYALRSGSFGGGVAGGLSLLLAILAGLGLVGWFVLTLIGMGLCMMVPVAKRTKSIRIFAIVAFSCTVGVLAMWPLSIAAASIAGPLVIVVLIMAMVVGLTGFVCWILFLRDVAVADLGLRSDLVKFMIIVLVFPWVAFFLQLLALRISAVVLVLLLIAISLCSLALEAWYAWLVYQVRADVDEKLPG